MLYGRRATDCDYWYFGGDNYGDIGILHRSRVAMSQAEMQLIAETFELFRVQYSHIPTSSSDFSAILKVAHLYDSTRSQ
jgi:hypothetical protein